MSATKLRPGNLTSIRASITSTAESPSPRPLQKPGAYLVSAKMENGNTSKIVVWVADTVIVRKQLSGKSLFYVADAVTGKPIANANLEFLWLPTKEDRRKPLSNPDHQLLGTYR